MLLLVRQVTFHKACAKYFILPCVFVHATLHYFNYGRAPYYHAIFRAGGYPPTPAEAAWGATYGGYGLTGQIIVLAMFLIYSGAHERVKRSHYETFWNTHHLYLVFFVALLFHGSVFWQWALPTLLPYLLDRFVVRVYLRGRAPFALAKVMFWGPKGKPDVLTLQFENSVDDKGRKPMDYMEGHYLYLQCPRLERQNKNRLLPQWHPFTISSAPDEKYLEVNIRIGASPWSWTRQVCDYLMLFDPERPDGSRSGAVQFETRNVTSGGTTLGKVLGPDGLPFFKVRRPEAHARAPPRSRSPRPRAGSGPPTIAR